MDLLSSAKLFVDEIKERGLLNDCTNIDKFLINLSENKKTYLGIDPTAKSLHIGNYLSLTFLKRLEDFGFKTVVVLGNFTAVIGDPSFKTNERPILSSEEIEVNILNIEKQVRKICPKSEIIKNLSFYKDISLMNLLQDISSNINVSEILAKDFLKDRLKTGLTITEFLYPLFQSYDFYYLFSKHDVYNQIGGSDQWGNITSGIEFIRKKINTKNLVTGLTLPLLVDENNKKFGKSENNAYFLDSTMTSPYALYQYILNIGDDLAYKYTKLLSFKGLNEINEVYEEFKKAVQKRLLQKTLAFEIVETIHSKDIAIKTQNISEQIFNNSYFLTKSDFEMIANTIPTKIYQEEQNVVQVLKDLDFAKSTSEVKRLIESSSISFFANKVSDIKHIFSFTESNNGFFLIKKGKKDFGLIKVCN